MPDSIRHPGNSPWIPTYVGMTCTETTAHFAIILENEYIKRLYEDERDATTASLVSLMRDAWVNGSSDPKIKDPTMAAD